MFNIGPGEIILIGVVALLLLGPDKLPELARGLGKAFREFRKHTDDVRGMVEREFYKMDQDVLHDGSFKSKLPEVSTTSDARLVMPRSEAIDAEPRILPPASFPAFPVPEGVVASRPPPVEPLVAPPPPAPAPGESAPSDAAGRSDGRTDGVPRRDG
jgi:sec-independent protein translocase protein TatB